MPCPPLPNGSRLRVVFGNPDEGGAPNLGQRGPEFGHGRSVWSSAFRRTRVLSANRLKAELRTSGRGTDDTTREKRPHNRVTLPLLQQSRRGRSVRSSAFRRTRVLSANRLKAELRTSGKGTGDTSFVSRRNRKFDCIPASPSLPSVDPMKIKAMKSSEFWQAFNRFAYLHGMPQAKRAIRPIIRRNYITTAVVSEFGSKYLTRDEVLELFELSDAGPTEYFKSRFGDPVDWELVWNVRGPTRIWRD